MRGSSFIFGDSCLSPRERIRHNKQRFHKTPRTQLAEILNGFFLWGKSQSSDHLDNVNTNSKQLLHNWIFKLISRMIDACSLYQSMKSLL